MAEELRGYELWKSLGLSVRARNGLLEADCKTIDEVRQLGPIGFIRTPNVGKLTVKEVAHKIGWESRKSKKEETVRRSLSLFTNYELLSEVLLRMKEEL